MGAPKEGLSTCSNLAAGCHVHHSQGSRLSGIHPARDGVLEGRSFPHVCPSMMFGSNSEQI